MDLQGTPISGGGDGQKVTTDPRSKDPKQESTGYVDPESLAAESSTFQNNNPGSNPPGTTDARNLTSATGGIGHISSTGQSGPEASDSVLDAGPGSAGHLGAVGGGGSNVSGGGITHSTTSGGNSGHGDAGSGTGLSATTDANQPAHRDAAPGYITSVVSDLSGGPKGRNLTEGGFEGTAPEGFAEPGSKDDPGRQAVNDMGLRNAASAHEGGPRDSNISGGTRYGNLDPDTQA